MTAPAFGQAPPAVRAPVPGPVGTRWVDALAAAECPALTARRARRAERAGAPNDPIVWIEARGANVRDADGNVYVDLTSGFGVAAVGHGHPDVVAAVQAQAAKLLHALGDLHPSDVKVRLLERLAGLAPWPDARVILGAHGGDAVEAALKTAALATGRHAVLAFEGGYHGLGYGSLSLCGYAPSFRAPFAPQLNPEVRFAPYPDADEDRLDDALARVAAVLDDGPPVGAVVVEPMLGRGGGVLPPAGFLEGLGRLARARGALLVADEIFVGLGRLGPRFPSVADGASPDLICIGKALGGGMPVSACLGRREVMAAWGDPAGEAIHTATFLGHPPACAAALATLDVLDGARLGERAARLGAPLLEALGDAVDAPVRGRGLVAGVVLGDAGRTLRAVRHLLESGWLALPAGPGAEVLQLLPPLTIDEALLSGAVDAVAAAVRACR